MGSLAVAVPVLSLYVHFTNAAPSGSHVLRERYQRHIKPPISTLPTDICSALSLKLSLISTAYFCELLP